MRRVAIPPPGHKSKTDHKRAVQEWNGERFLRSQSFLAAIEQIVGRAHRNDVIRIGICGEMGSGKSTLANSIMHAFHRRMKAKFGVPFAVRVFGARELADLDGTLNRLPLANYCVSFDDVSFMDAHTDGKALAKVKNTLTTIRHRHDGHDVKFVIIYGYHYGRGLDKYIRQVDFNFWTSIGEEENEYVEGKFRNRRHGSRTIRHFQKQHKMATDMGKWNVRYGRHGLHTYRYRDPFIPLLFSSGGGNIRPIVGPTVDFLLQGNRCHICDVGTESGRRAAANAMEPAAFLKQADAILGADNVRQALRQIGIECGMATPRRGVLNAQAALEASLAHGDADLRSLLEHLGLWAEHKHKRRSHDEFIAAIRAPTGGRPKEAKQADKRKERRPPPAGRKSVSPVSPPPKAPAA